MSSYQNMINDLLPIAFYSLNVGDLVCKELQSYSDQIDGVSDEIETVLRECFLSTAEDIGLSSYEELVGAERIELTLEERRDMVKKLLLLDENDFTYAGVMRFFDSLGFECTITEYPQYFDLLIEPVHGGYSETEKAYIRKRAEEFLPCHLTFTIEFRQADWNSYDALENTFDDWDALGMDWDELDRYDI